MLAAERLGLDAKDCYVFEDAYNGVQAGVASKAKTIMIPDLVQPTEEIRNMVADVCTTLKEASDKIEKNLL